MSAVDLVIKEEYIEVITDLLNQCNKESVFILIKRLLEQQV